MWSASITTCHGNQGDPFLASLPASATHERWRFNASRLVWRACSHHKCMYECITHVHKVQQCLHLQTARLYHWCVDVHCRSMTKFQSLLRKDYRSDTFNYCILKFSTPQNQNLLSHLISFLSVILASKNNVLKISLWQGFPIIKSNYWHQNCVILSGTGRVQRCYLISRLELWFRPKSYKFYG